MSRKSIILSLGVLLLLVVLNVLSSYIFTRFDLTEDKRYTLSEPTLDIVGNIASPIIIDVLLAGDLPSEFEKLRVETELILQEFASENDNIKFSFVDPLEEQEEAEGTIRQLQSIGLTPASVTTEEDGRISQELVFPWAMVNRGTQTVRVPLLKNKLGASTEERVNNSVQNLEYAFADAFKKIQITDKKKIAVLKGNGELEDIYIADFLSSIHDYYNIGAITFDSVPDNGQKVFDQLKEFDLAIIAKPTESFTDQEKYILDQYMVQGGRSLWLIDQVQMELDSLFNEEGTSVALPRDLNIADLLFKYGIRINNDLISDLYFTQIVLATGEDAEAQYSPVPWYYHPMVFSKDSHPTNNNVEALRFQFTSSIDTLSNSYTKTVLYQSSPLSKTEGVPRQISLSVLNSPPEKKSFNNGNKVLAVLVEGSFESAYKNRLKPLDLKESMVSGDSNKMVVISDGDLIKNQIRKGRPLELGYDKWTNNFFGNKEFLINVVNYLLEDDGLINIRSKAVRIPLLDPEKISEQKSKWQLINIGLPMVFVLLFGWLFNLRRKRKYGG